MKLGKFALAAVCAIGIPCAVMAGPAKAGKWETTSQATVGGQAMPSRTSTHCVTKEEADNAEKLVPPSSRNDCKMSDVKVDGGTVSWKMTCEKSGMTGDGTITYSGESYTGHMNMKSPQMDVTVKYSGKYVGPCD